MPSRTGCREQPACHGLSPAVKRDQSYGTVWGRPSCEITYRSEGFRTVQGSVSKGHFTSLVHSHHSNHANLFALQNIDDVIYSLSKKKRYSELVPTHLITQNRKYKWRPLASENPTES